MKTLQFILARLRPAYHKYKHSLNELSFVAIWVAVYISIAPVFRWIDPTAGPLMQASRKYFKHFLSCKII